MDIFLTSKHFTKYFLCMRWWFSRSFKSCSLPYTVINFLSASLKLLNNFDNAYWNPPQNSLLCGWSLFSSSDLSLAARKMRKCAAHVCTLFSSTANLRESYGSQVYQEMQLYREETWVGPSVTALWIFSQERRCFQACYICLYPILVSMASLLTSCNIPNYAKHSL